MIRRLNGRHAFLLGLAGAVALGLALPAAAQSTGMVKGLVRDDKGQPVDGAKITIDFMDGVNRHQETKSNKKGEFVQIGLQGGNYKVTAEKPGVGSQSFDVRIRIGQFSEVNFVLAGNKTGPTKEDLAKSAELKKTFEEGVAASKTGSLDDAIAKFQHQLAPTHTAPESSCNSMLLSAHVVAHCPERIRTLKTFLTSRQQRQ